LLKNSCEPHPSTVVNIRSLMVVRNESKRAAKLFRSVISVTVSGRRTHDTTCLLLQQQHVMRSTGIKAQAVAKVDGFLVDIRVTVYRHTLESHPN
jgi:hypothetical protein